MASSDYRRCDVCGEKCFYDAHLNYSFPGPSDPDFNNPEHPPVQDEDYNLDYLGAWKVLCRDCAKEHKVVIVPRPKE